MDNTQYDKRFTNRNKIVKPDGFLWISVPINKSHKFSLNKDVAINNDIHWQKDHWQKIFHSYNKSKFFQKYKDDLKQIFEKKWEYLLELDMFTMKKTFEWLGIKIDIIKETELNINGNETEKLINICKAVGADSYISGRGLVNKPYLQEELFEKNKIQLIKQEYSSIIYEQNLTNNFIPDLSIIDALCNVGPNTLEVLMKHNN